MKKYLVVGFVSPRRGVQNPVGVFKTPSWYSKFTDNICKKLVFIFLIISSFCFSGHSQEKEKKISVSISGYLTTMQRIMFDSLSVPFLNENLLHNRLNFKAYMGNTVTFSAELRNRLFTGDLVRLGKDSPEMIGAA